MRLGSFFPPKSWVTSSPSSNVFVGVMLVVALVDPEFLRSARLLRLAISLEPYVIGGTGMLAPIFGDTLCETNIAPENG